MTFIKLTKKDIPTITLIERENFSDGWNESLLSSAFDSGRFYALSLTDGNDVLGIITYSVAQDTADIEGVVTVKASRRQGVGARLVQRVLDDLKEQGVNKVFLEVRASNVPAINLYHSKGFLDISVRKKYYQDGEDAIVMAKEI